MERVRLVGGSRDGETALIENGLRQILLYPPLPKAEASAETPASLVEIECPPAETYRRSPTKPGVFRYVSDDLG